MQKLLFFLKTYFQKPPLGDGYNSEMDYSRYVFEKDLITWHRYQISPDQLTYTCYEHSGAEKKLPDHGWTLTQTADFGPGAAILDALGVLFSKTRILKRKPTREKISCPGELIRVKYSVEFNHSSNDLSYSGTNHSYLEGYYNPKSYRRNEFYRTIETIKFLLYEGTAGHQSGKK